MNGTHDTRPRPWETLSELRDVAKARREAAVARRAARKERRLGIIAASACAAAFLFFIGAVGFKAYQDHHPTPTDTADLSCHQSGAWMVCGTYGASTDRRQWFDPRWSDDMEGALPDYWYFGQHRYTTRDLMGRKL